MQHVTATREAVGPLARPHVWIGRARVPRSVVDACGIALLSIVASAIGFTGLWDVFRLTAEPVSPWWALAFALPACVLDGLRDRIPLVALVLAAALFAGDLVVVGGLGTLVVLLDILWHVVHRASPLVRKRIAVVLVVVTVLFLLAALERTADVRVALLVMLQVATLFGTDYWWAVAVGRAEEVAALERRRAADATRDAVREEREAVARELHDLVAGHVSAMAIRAEAALSSRPDEECDRAALRALRDASLGAHGALRSMISVLREGDGAVSPAPQLEDVATFVHEAGNAGLRVALDDRLTGVEGISPLVGQAVARVVREALANSARHASGADVEVRLFAEGDRVVVLVGSGQGSGRAHPALEGSGTGLALLAERVRALGGRFAAEPRNGGWAVRAELPREGPG